MCQYFNHRSLYHRNESLHEQSVSGLGENGRFGEECGFHQQGEYQKSQVFSQVPGWGNSDGNDQSNAFSNGMRNETRTSDSDLSSRAASAGPRSLGTDGDGEVLLKNCLSLSVCHIFLSFRTLIIPM